MKSKPRHIRYSAGLHRLLAGWLLSAGLAALPCSTDAQVAATGGIDGRVFNSQTGQYLENARITIEGTQVETFTDAGGEYKFYHVPAGPVTVRAYFTSLAAQVEALTVTPGATLRRDFDLASLQGKGPSDTRPIKLSEFVVSTSKQMAGATIAINEQRVAAISRTWRQSTPGSATAFPAAPRIQSAPAIS